jgi:AcrR family transcriptional regulator
MFGEDISRTTVGSDPTDQPMTFENADISTERQRKIAHTTLELAFEVGPNAVSTSLIARRLGVSQPAIYKHFKSKDAIWLLVSEQLATRIIENVKTCRASSLLPKFCLRNLVLGHARFIQSVPAMPDIMVMRQATGSHQVIRQRLQKEMAHLGDLMVDLIERAQYRGELRRDIAPADIANLFQGIMQGQVLRMIVSRDPSRLVIDCERLFDLQIETLAQRRPIS